MMFLGGLSRLFFFRLSHEFNTPWEDVDEIGSPADMAKQCYLTCPPLSVVALPYRDDLGTRYMLYTFEKGEYGDITLKKSIHEPSRRIWSRSPWSFVAESGYTLSDVVG